MDQPHRNPLIRQDFNGTYCLGFLNNHALDIEEIQNIFSAFGEVLTIKETGDKTGYRFVRYQYADEAENAVDGLKTHPKIKLVEHRPKSNKRSENQKNENKYENGNRRQYNNQNFDGNRNESKYQNGKGHSKKSNQNFNENFEENQNSNGVNIEVDQNSEFYKEENQVQNDLKSKTSNCKENSSSENLLYNAKSYNSLNSIPDNNNIKTKANSFTSSLSNESLSVEGNHSTLDIPDLVSSEKFRVANSAPKKIILHAEEIIVGNIPNDFGSAFILHLFERYNPIAISDINFVNNSGIRYCHVYFKTVHDTLVVEKTFDRMNLAGQKLLVLRPCQLIQEALC